VLAFSLVGSSPEAGAQVEQVSFCHATFSVRKPYRLATTDADAIVRQGHGSHTGPVFPADGWGDIIPPFDYSEGHFPGLNWPAGGAILAAVRWMRRSAARRDDHHHRGDDHHRPSDVHYDSGDDHDHSRHRELVDVITSDRDDHDDYIVDVGDYGTGTDDDHGGGDQDYRGRRDDHHGDPAIGHNATHRRTPEQHPPRVRVISAGEALPQVRALVILPGGKIFILGTLTPDQVERLQRELGARIAHTGVNESWPVVVGLLVLVVGCTSLGFATRRRGTPT
jgi:hypothetical protein